MASLPPLLFRQYAALAPPSTLNIPSSSKEAHDILLSIIDDPHLSSYPPSQAYKTRFFKRVVDELEARADYPIDEAIYEAFLEALSSGSEGCGAHSHSHSHSSASILQVNAPQPGYKTHYYPFLHDRHAVGEGANGVPGVPGPAAARTPAAEDDEEEGWGRLTVFESPSLVEAGTTGLRTWRAALWTGEWLLQHSEVVQGKRVLELGSGTGFLGILVAQIQLRTAGIGGGGEVWMTDVSETVLQRSATNVHLPCNKLEAHQGIHLLPLDWTSPASELEQRMEQIKPDVVLACDVIFDTSIIPDLVKVIKLALATAGECWVAGAVRNIETMEAFVREAESRGLEVKAGDWEFGEGERVFLGGNEGGEGMGEVRLMRLTRVEEGS